MCRYRSRDKTSEVDFVASMVVGRSTHETGVACSIAQIHSPTGGSLCLALRDLASHPKIACAMCLIRRP
jgi:hypothetical protein